jgi:hypothetical protein
MAEITDNSVEILGQDLIEVTVDPASVIEIDVDPSPVIEISVASEPAPDVEIIQGQTTEIEIQPPSVVDVDILPPNVVEVEVFPGGVVYKTVGSDPVYKEFTYTGENLTLINTWDNSDKDTFLVSTTLSYTGSNLTQKVVTNQVTDEVRTTTYAYSGVNLVSYSEVVS